MRSHLARFLAEPGNSVSREVLLSHRVTLDLKIASAHSGIDLRVYRPDVDRDGFDLLVEQRSIARVLQLKSVMRGATTRRWRIRSHLLHPSRNRSDRLGFTLPKLGLGDGLDGGVLLVDVEAVDDDVRVCYRYFDLAVAAAHASGQTAAGAAQEQQAFELIKRLRAMSGVGSVVLTAGMFLRVPTAEGVLALLGMRTRYQGSWAYHALWAFRLWETDGCDEDGRSFDEHAVEARKALAAIASASHGIATRDV